MPQERPVFTPSMLAAFLQCERRFWLEAATAAKALGAAAPASPKREMDALAMGAKFKEHVGKDPGAQVFLREAGPCGPGQEPAAPKSDYKTLSARPRAVLLKAGAWSVMSAKASSSTSAKARDKAEEKAKEDGLFDLAAQVWVFERANGQKLAGASVSFLNKEFVGAGQDLFVEAQVLEIARQTARDRGFDAHMDGWLLAMEDLALHDEMPQTRMGAHCKRAGECPFMGFCEKREPAGEAHPIDLLPDAGGKALAKRLASLGVKSLLDASDEQLSAPKNPKAQALYRRMRDAHASGQAILEPEAKARLDALPYPRSYFDFEGIDFAVPRWEGVAPYVQVPFQWSCHVESSPGVFEHGEFLDVSGGDPSLSCAQAMLEFLPASGPIFVYHKTYEEGRIKELAARFAQHGPALMAIAARLVDLLPIARESYYHPDMRGSFSIKAVLPCVAPELSYASLECVQNGTQAQEGYLEAISTKLAPSDREDLIKPLLAYCRQDTWAMVRLAHFLEEMPAMTDAAATAFSAISRPANSER